VDQVAVRAALRCSAAETRPEDGTSALCGVFDELSFAARRKARADAEVACIRRPSTLKESLKSTFALELALARARDHVRAELRLLGTVTTVHPEPVRLRACG
jgi:hypothetical protein